MQLSPQFKIAGSLVALLLSCALIGDALGLLPRPEARLREARKIIGEALAVQISTAASTGSTDTINRTLASLVQRNDDIVYADLTLEEGRSLASYGEPRHAAGGVLDLSTLDSLIVPIYRGSSSWGKVRLQFSKRADWGLRYFGFPATSLVFLVFLGTTCLVSYYFFLRRALKELSPSKALPERVNQAFEVLAEGVLILNENQQIMLANAAFAKRVGSSVESLLGKSPNGLNWDLNGEGAQRYPWAIALETSDHVMNTRLQLTVDNSVVTFTVNAAPIRDPAGKARGVLVTFDDVSTLEAKNSELARMLAEVAETQRIIEMKNRELEVLATRDAMTGTLNRRSFLGAAERAFQKAREQGTPLSAMMVDIDHFKSVNDNFGHLVGDKAIKALADALMAFFPAAEAVGRYGGEEFVVSMPGVNALDAKAAAERLRRYVATLADSEELPMSTLTVSIGVSELTEDVKDLTELVDRADRGLYKAKETGRNQVCLFDPAYVPAAKRKPSAAAAKEDEGSETVRRELEAMKKRVRDQADEIAYRSLYDSTTRLPNQLLLADRIDQAVKQSLRSEKPGAVISIGLSGYQNIAELDDHNAAEKLMLKAAQRLQSVVRESDSVSAVANDQSLTFSRTAHNELAILANNLDDVMSATRLVERLSHELERPIDVDGHKILSRVYCGIALFPSDGEHSAALTRNATLARRFAERRSPHMSGSAYFSAEIDAEAVKNARIAAELHDALLNEKLSVAYQPKVDAQTREVIGVEALARWHSESLGPVNPEEFVELAEHLGLVSLLTDFVCKTVCRDIADEKLGGVRVSINVSPLELSNADTAGRILGILDAFGIPANRIGLELTENAFLNDKDRGRHTLQKLRDAGVLVSLDDFGTGYSSLNMLAQIPVDIIKIDRSFVTGIEHATTNRSIVQAILALADTLGKRVVAEGVSSDAEYACLRQMGCREIQGFLFAKPMSTNELADYFKQVGVRPRFVANPVLEDFVAAG